MKKNAVCLLVVGILIQLAALFGEHAVEIPFVLKIIAPGYFHANNRLMALEADSSLTLSNTGDRGFLEIAKIVGAHTRTRIHGTGPFDISVLTLNVSGSAFFDSKLSTAINWQFDLDALEPQRQHVTNASDSCSLEVVQQRVDELKNPNLLMFCFGMFALGTFIDIVAFCLEGTEEHKKPVT